MSDSPPDPPRLTVIQPQQNMSCACKWRIGLAVLLAVVVVVVTGWWWSGSQRDSLTRLPAISLEAVGPGVRRAIQDATELVRRKPHSGPSWGRLGMVLLAHNFEEAADACFKVARELDPRAARWAYCAGVGQAVVDPARASISFQQAAELAPQEPWPKFRLAELLMDTQQLDRAEEVLRTIDAGDQQTRLIYDQVRLALLRNDLSVLKQLDTRQLQALKTGANRRACLELLAQVWHRLGRRSEADSTKRLLSETGPGEGWNDPYVSEIFQLRRDPNWLANVARQDLASNRVDRAVRQMEELIVDYPDDPQWPIGLAGMWGQLQQPAKSLQVLRAAVAQHPESAQMQFEIGNLEFRAANWPAAGKAYAEAARLKPDYALAYYNLGQVELKRGRNDNALQAFRDALRSQPDLAPALINVGDLLSRTGKPEDLFEARQALQRALKVAPQDARAAELLEKLPRD